MLNNYRIGTDELVFSSASSPITVAKHKEALGKEDFNLLVEDMISNYEEKGMPWSEDDPKYKGGWMRRYDGKSMAATAADDNRSKDSTTASTRRSKGVITKMVTYTRYVLYTIFSMK